MKWIILILMLLATTASAQVRVGASAGIVSFDSATGLSGPSLEVGASVQRTHLFVRTRLRYHHLVGSDSTIATTRLGRQIVTGMLELGMHFADTTNDTRPFATFGASVITYVESRSGRFYLQGTPPEQRMVRFAPHVGFGIEQALDEDLRLLVGGTVAYTLGPDAPFHWVGGLSVGVSMGM